MPTRRSRQASRRRLVSEVSIGHKGMEERAKAAQRRVWPDLITSLATECTVVLVEHKMKMVMGLCERLIVLHHGELLAQGTPSEIRANVEVRRVYLGQG